MKGTIYNYHNDELWATFYICVERKVHVRIDGDYSYEEVTAVGPCDGSCAVLREREWEVPSEVISVFLETGMPWEERMGFGLPYNSKTGELQEDACERYREEYRQRTKGLTWKPFASHFAPHFGYATSIKAKPGERAEIQRSTRR